MNGGTTPARPASCPSCCRASFGPAPPPPLRPPPAHPPHDQEGATQVFPQHVGKIRGAAPDALSRLPALIVLLGGLLVVGRVPARHALLQLQTLLGAEVADGVGSADKWRASRLTDFADHALEDAHHVQHPLHRDRAPPRAR